MRITLFTLLFIWGVVLGFAFTAVAQDNNVGKVPMTTEKPTVNYNSITHEAPTRVSTAYAYTSLTGQFVSMPIPAGEPFTNIAPMSTQGLFSSATFGPDGTLYFTDTTLKELYIVDVGTGALTLVGSTDVNLNGITYDWANDVFWGVSFTALYTVDIKTGATTMVGSFGLGGGELMIDVAVDYGGNMYAYDLTSDSFYSIDPATGAATLIGSLGYNANYTQGMSFDYSTGILYLSAFNSDTYTAQLRTVDVATGNTTLVFDWGYTRIGPFAIPACTVGDPSNPNPEDGTVDVPINLPEISWTNTPEATEIELFFGPVDSVTFVYSGPPITSFALNGLDNSTEYKWYVKQSDGNCWITGPAWTFTTIACVGDPSNPNPADGAIDVPINLPEISWTNTPEATEIELFFGPVDSVTSVYSGPPITSFALTGLDYNTEYDWYVKQSNGSCWITGPAWTFTTVYDPNIVFMDEFPTDMSQWTILGPLGLTNWSWQPTFIATGNPADAGEMRFYHYLLFTGDSYVISDTIPSAGHDLTVQFSHQLYFYSGLFTIGFGYTMDGGTTWTPLWQAIDPTGDIGPETLTFPNVPGDANFQLGFWLSGNSNGDWYIDNVYVSYIVPVEMTSFAASVNDGDITLNWSTATETNNQGFEIERKVGSKSASGGAAGNWDKIGYVAGFGTTTEPKTYSFIDYNLTTGIYSYRLKQIDYDGTFEYSDAVEVDVTVPKIFALGQNYPNPFNPSTMIKFSLAADSRVTLTVFDILGQEVANLISGNLAAGSHEFNFDASNLNSGVYFYRIDAAGVDGTNFTSVKKMILTK